MPDVAPLQGLVGRRVALPGHFVDAVTVVDARPLGAGAELRVRQADGGLDEAALSREGVAGYRARDLSFEEANDEELPHSDCDRR